MKIFPESEDSESLSLNESPIEFTPIVMFSLPESSNDETVIETNGVELDDDAKSELKKCKCFQNPEAENKELELGSEEKSDGLSDFLNKDFTHIVVPLSVVPMKGVCENVSENFQEDGVCGNESENVQEDEIFLTASEQGDIAECEPKICNVLEEKEMMFEDLEKFESGPTDIVNEIVNQEPKLSVSAEENVQIAEGVCENAKENMKEVDMLEFESSDSVIKTANAKPESSISAKKNEEMAAGVCGNTTENIEDVDILEFEDSNRVESTAKAKPESSISAKKKEKMAQGVCGNAKENMNDVDMLEFDNSDSVTKTADLKPKSPISAEKNEEMASGVCDNTKENIEDVDILKFEHCSSVENTAKPKPESSISAKKKEKMAEGVYENATENIENTVMLEFEQSVKEIADTKPMSTVSAKKEKMVTTQNIEDPSSLDSFSKSKGKLPCSFPNKKRKIIGDGSTKITSTSGMNIGFYDLIGCVNEDKGGDFMQTAVNRGMHFPRPRWWPQEGCPKTFDG